MPCTVCGNPLPDDARFCPNCGAPVTSSLQTQERKVVTVLFADIVDSTGLAQRLDSERTREVLGRFYDTVTEELRTLRGTPEKFIGDAVMAVFGLPHVHEDDGVRAVRAGLAICGRVRRLTDELGLEEPLRVRVGIETGEAATGVGPTGQLLVTGSVVNEAARLQTAASPDEVLAGATLHALTEASVSFGDRRDVPAKGFEGGLVAYTVEGLSTRSVRRTIPFVGRAAELTMLRDGYARTVATGRPLLVTVFGESGIGKSRLADEFVAGVAEHTTVLTGRSNLATDSTTFAPAAWMVRDVAGIDHDDPPEKALQRLRELMERGGIASAEDPQSDDDDGRTVERLALLLGLARPPRDESPYIQDVQAGVVSLVERLASQAPVALVLDDVHLLRAPMLDLIERLASRTRRDQARTLVLVTARPELLNQRPGWGSRAVNHMMLHLDPLAADDALALVRQASGGRIDGAQAQALATRAGGNPFFIVESTGALLSGDEARGLPPTVQAVVASRLDALPDASRELARRLAVFGESFDLSEARVVVPETDLEGLAALEDAEILVREDAGGEGFAQRWRVRHETLREVAYASLPKRLRLQLHLAVADSLMEGSHISFAAEHLERAAQASLDLDPLDRTVPERAADALVAAGHRARRRMEARSAIDYYKRALEMEPDPARWGVREARALAGIGEARYWLAEYPGATEALERAATLGTELNDDWTLALALRFLGDIAINVDADLDKAQALLDRSLESAEALDDPWVIARTLLFLGWVPWSRHRFDRAEPSWQRALSLARDNDDRWAEVRALTNLSINHEDMQDAEGAAGYIDEAEVAADAMDDQFSVAVTTVQRGRLYGDEGRHEEAVANFDRAVEIFADLGARWELADAMAERGISKRELGQLDGAEKDLRQAIGISEELGERQLAGWTWRALARVAERRGDRTQAEERFRRAEQEEARRPQ